MDGNRYEALRRRTNHNLVSKTSVTREEALRQRYVEDQKIQSGEYIRGKTDCSQE